ncbi:hypothetical protein ACET3X_003720 [Alternaria dauci]|uniref:RRM domain-containing protein n=1 Tax=Alternaria dauci TaxID=48095 RepID=A0ABR3UMQ8_9PLEO
MSTIVSISRLPLKTEPYLILLGFWDTSKDEIKDDIKDIYSPPGGGDCARVVFNTHGIAKKFVEHFDNSSFGVTDLRVIIRLRDEPEAELVKGFPNRLSDYLRARENGTLSRTVEITGLPKRHTLRNLSKLMQPINDHAYGIEESNYAELVRILKGEPPVHRYVEGIETVRSRCAEPGVALRQLYTHSMAISLVYLLNGTYWREKMVIARRVPDERMEKIISKEAAEKDVVLFVGGIRIGATVADVRDIFKDVHLCDVTLPPGDRNFCFVVIRKWDASAVLARFGNGLQWHGYTIRVSVSHRENRKTKSSLGVVGEPPAALPQDTTDLKLNNLPYDVAESDVRTFFAGFTVTKIVLKQGYAFVRIATSEVGRAMELSGKTVGGRKISVKVSQSRMW